MYVDLRLTHCVELEFEAKVSLEASQLEPLRKAVKTARQSEAWPWLFAEKYTVNNQQYVIEGSLRPSMNGELHDLRVRFFSGEFSYGRPAPVDELLQVVTSQPATVALDCSATFNYSEEESTAKIPLPIDSPGPEHIQIRGIRVVLLDEHENEEFSTIIDRPTNAEYFQTISFQIDAALSRELPREILQRASSISGAFFAIERRSPRAATRMRRKR